jgi:hypothetical protein
VELAGECINLTTVELHPYFRRPVNRTRHSALITRLDRQIEQKIGPAVTAAPELRWTQEPPGERGFHATHGGVVSGRSTILKLASGPL